MSKNNKKNKLFGRNLFTILFVVFGTILISLLIYSPVTYIKEYNENKANPFTDSDKTPALPEEEDKYNVVNRVKPEEFDLFDLTFKCDSVDANASNKSATFVIEAEANEMTSSIEPTVENASYDCYVALASDWVDFYKTSSSKRTLKNLTATSGKTSSQTVTVNYGDVSFPLVNEKTFPVKMTVKAPDAYLYISYTTKANGKSYNTIYLIKYAPEDYLKGSYGTFISNKN